MSAKIYKSLFSSTGVFSGNFPPLTPLPYPCSQLFRELWEYIKKHMMNSNCMYSTCWCYWRKLRPKYSFWHKRPKLLFSRSNRKASIGTLMAEDSNIDGQTNEYFVVDFKLIAITTEENRNEIRINIANTPQWVHNINRSIYIFMQENTTTQCKKDAIRMLWDSVKVNEIW